MTSNTNLEVQLKQEFDFYEDGKVKPENIVDTLYAVGVKVEDAARFAGDCSGFGSSLTYADFISTCPAFSSMAVTDTAQEPKFMRPTHRTVAARQTVADIHIGRVPSKEVSVPPPGKDFICRKIGTLKLVVPQGPPSPEGLSLFCGHHEKVLTRSGTYVYYATEAQVTSGDTYDISFADGKSKSFKRKFCYKLNADCGVPSSYGYGVLWELPAPTSCTYGRDQSTGMEVLHGYLYPKSELQLEDTKCDTKMSSYVAKLPLLDVELGQTWHLCCSRLEGLTQAEYEQYEMQRIRGLKASAEPSDADDFDDDGCSVSIVCQALQFFALFSDANDDTAEALAMRTKMSEQRSETSLARAIMMATSGSGDSYLLDLVLRALDFFRLHCGSDETVEALALMSAVQQLREEP